MTLFSGQIIDTDTGRLICPECEFGKLQWPMHITSREILRCTWCARHWRFSQTGQRVNLTRINPKPGETSEFEVTLAEGQEVKFTKW